MAVTWFHSMLKRRPRATGQSSRKGRKGPSRPRALLAVQQLEDRLTPSSVLQNINHIVVIYQENWSFDSLYGLFPGANGLANASATSRSQIDRLTGQPYTSQLGQPFDLAYKGPALTTPPQPINNGAIDPNFPAGLNTLHPYNLSHFISPGARTGDLVHRFFQEQSQINGGLQNQFMTWSDNPGLVFSYFDATNLPEGLLAQQYTMDDNFFHAAFGGSFLNHQFLVAAAAPVYANAATLDPGGIAKLDSTGQLLLNATTGKIVHDGNITPIGGASFGDPGQTYDKNYAINTIFSKNLAPDFIGNTTSAGLLPSVNDSNPNGPNYIPTIGDQLDGAGVSWKWYSGGWDNALAGSPSNPANNGTTPTNDPAALDFQWHHQPLAYYDNFAPWLSNGQRNPLSAAHLQDEINFFADLQAGTLPSVSFIKPLGPDNEHPGYTSLLQGQQHVADIVHAIQNSPDWAHTAIVVTYDENGGRWDHVTAPDNNGIWGDGSRVPAIVISPYAKQGFVDHTEHDTLSIMKTIDERFGLQPLNSLVANGSDLSSSFQDQAHVSIGKAYLQPDAYTIGQNVLVVQGTEGNDVISLRETPDGTGIVVRLNPFDPGQTFAISQISRIQIYGQGGRDQIYVDPSITLPAQIFAGAGDNFIAAGSGNTVVVGGAGNNFILGGPGRDILIGGTGRSIILGNTGSSILIAGFTKYGQDAEALQALENEWATPNESVATHVAKLEAGVTFAEQTFALNDTTVFSNGHLNILVGGSGMNWYLGNLSTDLFFLVFGQDVVTAIHKQQ